MSEELAESIVEAAKKMHQNDLLRWITPLYACVVRLEAQYGEEPNAKYKTIKLDTKYTFLDNECDDMAEVLIMTADKRFVKIEYLDGGIVDTMKRDLLPDELFKIIERNIIAYYQKVD